MCLFYDWSLCFSQLVYYIIKRCLSRWNCLINYTCSKIESLPEPQMKGNHQCNLLTKPKLKSQTASYTDEVAASYFSLHHSKTKYNKTHILITNLNPHGIINALSLHFILYYNYVYHEITDFQINSMLGIEIQFYPSL